MLAYGRKDSHFFESKTFFVGYSVCYYLCEVNIHLGIPYFMLRKLIGGLSVYRQQVSLLFFFLIPWFLCAQRLTVFNPVVCVGVSVYANGSLYQLADGQRIISIKEKGGTIELKDQEMLKPEKTTVYVIRFKDSDGIEYTQEAVITVKTRPYIKAECLFDIREEFCAGTQVSFQVVENRDGDPVHWTVSGQEEVQSGDYFKLTLTRPCVVRVQASNGICPVSDTTFPINVLSSPTAPFYTLDIVDSIGGTFCKDCGFAPGLKQVLKGVDGADTIDYASSYIVWEDDPGYGDKILELGVNRFESRLHYKISSSNKCGSWTKEGDSVFDMVISGVVDCAPRISSEVLAVQPCTPVNLYVQNTHFPMAFFNGTPGLSLEGNMGDWNVGNAVYVPEPSLGRESYLWPIELENYTGNVDMPTIHVAMSYKLQCPYGSGTVVPPVVVKEVLPMLDTTSLQFRYSYCPDQNAVFELEGISGQTQIEKVEFLSPDGIEEEMPLDPASQPHYRKYVGHAQINEDNLHLYSPLEVVVGYQVSKGSCHYTVTEREKVALLPKENCDMSFELGGKTSCMGEKRSLVFSVNEADVECIDIAIDDAGVFSMGDVVYTQQGAGGRLDFEPYFPGADHLSSQKGTIYATVTYKIGVSEEILTWTKAFDLEVNSCKPSVKYIYMPSDCPTCQTCAGTDLFVQVDFPNPTSRQEYCKVDWAPDPPSPIRQVYSETGVLRSPVWSTVSGKLIFRFISYLFDNTLMKIGVEYNEGDSLYVIDNLPIVSGGTVIDSFQVSPDCRLIIEPERDSCCLGDVLDTYIYTTNPYDTLKRIEWDASVASYLTPLGSGLVESDFEGGSSLKFAYKVEAIEGGIYPFKVYSQVRDSLLVYMDTLRLSVLTHPRIFVQDTVFVCTNMGVDLRPYIDTSLVREIVEPSDPSDWIIDNVLSNQYRFSLARMRHKCNTDILVSDSIFISTDQAVYIAHKNPSVQCPGSLVKLSVSTNGRVDWFRQYELEEGVYSSRDTLYTGLRSDEEAWDTLGDQVTIYTAVARTACPTPPEMSTVYRVEPYGKPHLEIVNTSACFPAMLEVKIDTVSSEIQDGSVRFWANGSEVDDSPLPPSDSVLLACSVVDTNGCSSRVERMLYSYPLPVIQIQPQGESSVYCLHQDDTVRFNLDMEGPYDFVWNLKGQTYPLVQEFFDWVMDTDTVLYATATDTVHHCSQVDSVLLTCFGKRAPLKDTLLCYDAGFSYTMPNQADVRYTWFSPGGDMMYTGPQLSFEPFHASDTGIYSVEIFRKTCADTQTISLRTPPYPDLRFLQDGRFCVGSPLHLEVQTLLPETLVGQADYRWYGPQGSLLQEGKGMAVYEGGPISLIDSGWYRLELVSSGCFSQDSVLVRVYEHTTPMVYGRGYLCDGDSAVWMVGGTSSGQDLFYRWIYQGDEWWQGTDSVWKIPMVDMGMKGDWLVEVTHGACKDTARFSMEVREVPVADIVLTGGHPSIPSHLPGTLDDGEMFFCQGMDAKLSLRQVLEGDTVEWYDARSFLGWGEEYGMPGIDTSEKGWYMAIIQRNGCQSVPDSVWLDVRLQPRISLTDTALCSGSELILDVQDSLYPGALWVWNRKDTADRLTVSTPGTYFLKVDYLGCTDSTYIDVVSLPTPVIGLPQDTSVCERDSICLRAPSGMDEYLWQDGSKEPVLWVTAPGLYELWVRDSLCSAEAEVNVSSEFCSDLYFPSAFTPGSDGVNDTFYPITSAKPEEVDYRLRIFNVDGQMVFSTNRLDMGWDGNFKGRPCPPGIYVFQCDAYSVLDGRNLSRRGTIVLVR